MQPLPEAPTVPVVPPRTIGPGRLYTGWRVVYALSWGGIFLSFTAVWEASRQLGLPTWWLGPTSRPRPFVIQLLPFFAPALAISCVSWNTKRLPWIGIAASIVTFAIGVGDVGTVFRLSLVECALGLAGMAMSIAAFTGLAKAPTVAPHVLDALAPPPEVGIPGVDATPAR